MSCNIYFLSCHSPSHLLRQHFRSTFFSLVSSLYFLTSKVYFYLTKHSHYKNKNLNKGTFLYILSYPILSLLNSFLFSFVWPCHFQISLDIFFFCNCKSVELDSFFCFFRQMKSEINAVLFEFKLNDFAFLASNLFILKKYIKNKTKFNKFKKIVSS